MLYEKKSESLIYVANVETKLLSSTTVLSSPHWPPFCSSFISPILALLLWHSVRLTSPSSLACSFFYPVGAIRLNIATVEMCMCCSCLEVIAQFCAVTITNYVMCS